MAYVSETRHTSAHVDAGWAASLRDTLRLWRERRRAYREVLVELSSLSTRELDDLDLGQARIREIAKEAAARVH